jgi:hypothetical protein
MADLAEIWKEVLPGIRQEVTGVGVWAALNACKPIAVEDGVLVMGLPHGDTELSGHLRMPQIKRLVESAFSERLGSPVALRVIEGVSQSDWETVKRRDSEARRLQDIALNKMRAELAAKSNWEHVYEQLGRRYAAVSNKSLPQNRARFFEEAVAIVAEARQNQATYDELAERNFARCIERLSQYSEVPSTLVAIQVLKAAGEL